MAVIQARFTEGGTDLVNIAVGNTLMINGKKEVVYNICKKDFQTYNITCLNETYRDDRIRFIIDHRYIATENMLKQGKLNQWAWLNVRDLSIPKKSKIVRFFMNKQDKNRLKKTEEERLRFQHYHEFLKETKK